MTEMRIRIELLEPLLGTVPKDQEVYRRFIESKKPSTNDEDESETVEDREKTGWTGFHSDTVGLFLFDYQVKGMLKELAKIAYPRDNAAGLKAVVSKLDMFVYVGPRRLYIVESATSNKPITKPDLVIERPLRAQTMQGPRVTVVRSDAVAAGRVLSCSVQILPGPITEDHIRTILDLGQYRGLGQFRNGSYGRFAWLLTQQGAGKAEHGKAKARQG